MKSDSTKLGFTLIELMVVVVIIALLSATAAMMVRVPLAKAQREQFLAQIRVLDLTARDRARQNDGVQLVFDQDQGTVRLTGAASKDIAPPVVLNGGLQVHLINADPTGRSIAYDRFGSSSSYAVRVGQDDPQGEWLLVLGMTGQIYNVKQGKVHAILNHERYHAR